MIHVALYQPVIPPNTGNIARQCIGMNAHLHLIGPLGFSMTEKAFRRAGLDYWQRLKLTIHDTPDDFITWLDNRTPYLITKFGEQRFDEPTYQDGDILLFGSETKGLPEDWHQRWPNHRLNIPILGQIRSYNLSNTVALVLGVASAKAGILDTASFNTRND